jgi:PiT family inorganic phosphate transporter
LLSAVGASVARALNDTPKIVGVGLLALELGGSSSNPIPKELLSALVSLAMVAGGFWASKLVMHTLAFRVTDLNLYSGVTANLTNWSLVSAGSFLGLPLSTTHVSGAAMVGSVYGTRCHKVRWKVVKNVSNAWLITVPATAVLAVIFSVIAQGLYAIF